MAAVTQSVDSYIMGVSTAPDKDIEPGYVKDARNVYPDITYGMTKRPGTTLINYLGKASDLDDAYYFIYRFNDKDELYFGAIYNKSLRIINAQTGVDATIVGGTNVAYLDGTKEDFRYRQKQEDLVIVNKSVTVAMDTDTVTGTVTGEVNTIAELPATPSTGDIYIIRGISGAADDYVISWDGSTWKETIQPGMKYKFDASTMPHRLVRTGTNAFKFEPIPWANRTTGVTTLEVVPSFVGKTISNLFFHKNRLGFTSSDNVILGQPNQLYNFWRVSALTLTDADPIDLTASSLRDVNLFAVQPLTQGLLLFSTREQFLMTAGNDGVLTPSTAAIRSISTYEMYQVFDPLFVNDKIFFASEASGYTRVLSMQPRGENNSPIFNDIGKPVSSYIPSGINRAISSNQNQFIALYDNSKSNAYFYRFYNEEGEVELKSWFRWDFPGKLLGIFFEQDQIFAAVSANDKVYLLLANIQTSLTASTIQTPKGNIFINPSLDYAQKPVSVAYNKNTKLSTITVASVDPNNSEWKPIVIEAYNGSTANGTFWECTKVTDTTYTVNANVTGITTLQFGFTYPYEINLPRTYYRSGDQADFTASLTVSRMNFALGRTGSVSFEVKPTGSANYLGVGEVDTANYYLLDTSPIDDERFFAVPIHQKNHNFEIRLSSDSPYPVSLLSMAWEGHYSPRFYQRS